MIGVMASESDLAFNTRLEKSGPGSPVTIETRPMRRPGAGFIVTSSVPAPMLTARFSMAANDCVPSALIVAVSRASGKPGAEKLSVVWPIICSIPRHKSHVAFSVAPAAGPTDVCGGRTTGAAVLTVVPSAGSPPRIAVITGPAVITASSILKIVVVPDTESESDHDNKPTRSAMVPTRRGNNATSTDRSIPGVSSAGATPLA